MGYSQFSISSSNRPGISYTQVLQQILEKSCQKPSDIPDIPVNPFKDSKFVKEEKDVFVWQPEIKPSYFARTIEEKTSHMKVESSNLNTTDIFENFSRVHEVPQQNIHTWSTLEQKWHTVNPLLLTDNPHKQNYVEFKQSYMGILNEVKHEAEQARSLDSDIEEIKNEAYDEFAVVMEEIYDAGVSMPEVTWNENGSLDIGWPLKMGGTSTILVYGDNHVIYNTYLGPNNYVESICKISDGLLLPKLIGILSNITE